MPGPFPIPNANHVPLIGQLCTILAHTQAVVAVCNCEAKGVFQIDGVNTVGQCRACGRTYRIAASNYDASTGQGTVSVSCVAAPVPSAADVKPS